MYHDKRVWCVRRVDTADELTDLLWKHDWCGCAGFELEGILWLNDSTSPDAVQEYAVVRMPNEASREYRQIESITVGWCNRGELLAFVKQLKAAAPAEANRQSGPVAVARTAAELFDFLGLPGNPPGFAVEPKIETPAEHGRCPHCA